MTFRHPRHAELVSASMPHRLCENGISVTGSNMEAWTLERKSPKVKQVQGDGIGNCFLRALTCGRLRLASWREITLLFFSREVAKARRNWSAGDVLRLLGQNKPLVGKMDIAE